MMIARKVPRAGRKRNRDVEQFALLLRNNMTPAEARLWKFLKKKQRCWKHKFLPQIVVSGYVPDFYCDTLQLAVEIDGKIHDRKDVRRNDKIRTRRLNKIGITVIRFRNSDVFTRLHSILEILQNAASVQIVPEVG